MTTERSTFELRLAEMFDGYADRAPVEVDAVTLATSIARARPRGLLDRSPATRRWLVPVLLAMLLLAATALAIYVGTQLLLPKPVRPLIVESTGSTSVGRRSHSATLLSDGRVMVTGGYKQRHGTPPEFPRTAEIYDPLNGTFTVVDRMWLNREHPASILLADGLVLVAGGAQSDPLEAHRTANIFDPRSGQFTETSPMVARRVSAAAVLLNDGRVLLVGGDSGARHPHWAQLLPLPVTAEIFDPQAGVEGGFEPVVGLTQAFAEFSGVVGTRLANGELLLASMTVRGEDAALAAPLLLDQQFDVTELPALPLIDGSSASAINAVVALHDGTVLVVARYGTESWHFLGFNPADFTYDDLATLPAPPVAPVVVLADGRVAALVGDIEVCSTLTAEIFDLAAREFERVGVLPAGRACQGMSPTLTALNDGGALIVGGYNATGGGSHAAELIHSAGR